MQDAAPADPKPERAWPFLGLVFIAALLIAGGGAAYRYNALEPHWVWLWIGLLWSALAVLAWWFMDLLRRWRHTQCRAQELAYFDTLTGLPNRTLFFDRLERIHLHSARYRRCYALLILDLDGFQTINEQFGYRDGDQLLNRVGRMLIHSLRQSDTIARLGGDEFAILLSEVTDTEAAMMLGRKVVAAVGAPVRLSQGEAEVGASVGIAVFPWHGQTQEDILHAADEAMHQAKHEGKGHCLLASPRLAGEQDADQDLFS